MRGLAELLRTHRSGFSASIYYSVPGAGVPMVVAEPGLLLTLRAQSPEPRGGRDAISDFGDWMLAEQPGWRGGGRGAVVRGENRARRRGDSPILILGEYDC